VLAEIFVNDILEFGIDNGVADSCRRLRTTNEFCNFTLGFHTELSRLDFLFDFSDHFVAINTEVADNVAITHLESIDLNVESGELGFDESLVRIDVLEGVANLDALLFGVLPSSFNGVTSSLHALVNNILNLSFIELISSDERFVDTLASSGLFVEFLELGLEFLCVREHVFCRLDVTFCILVVLVTDFFNLILRGDKRVEAALRLVEENGEEVELHNDFSFC
jgi:hypothetical protein